MAKIPNPKPFGISCDSFCRNWQTSKGRVYEENYDRIFPGRRSRPGFTRVVYRNGKKTEYANAELRSTASMRVGSADLSSQEIAKVIRTQRADNRRRRA